MTTDKIIKTFEDCIEQLNTDLLFKSEEKRVKYFNIFNKILQKYNLFKEPVATIQWVSLDKIHANDYNPNTVAPPEMKLLALSILLDGYTQPIVAYYDKDQDQYEVIDGFHRFLIGSTDKEIQDRIHKYLPLVVIDKPIEERKASTIRHNRARGKHDVTPMSDIVADLTHQGWTNERIAQELGMQADEILRLKQRTGLADVYKNEEFSKAWVKEQLFAPLKELKAIDPMTFFEREKQKIEQKE